MSRPDRYRIYSHKPRPSLCGYHQGYKAGLSAYAKGEPCPPLPTGGDHYNTGAYVAWREAFERTASK